MVLDKDLDAEIHKTEVRLSYLRQRKRTGYPSGRKSKSPYTKRKENNPVDNELLLFFRSNIMDGSFKKQYKDLYENMVVNSKNFVMFHNTVFRAIDKYGNNEHKAALKELMDSINPNVNYPEMQ